MRIPYLTFASYWGTRHEWEVFPFFSCNIGMDHWLPYIWVNVGGLSLWLRWR